MEKIVTIFDRNWEGDRGIIPVLAHHPGDTTATEKLDGTNVRLTVRDGTLVRVEARRNPSKQQKADGISEPWYRDAWQIGSREETQDQYIVEAAHNTPLLGVPDGEWAAEAVGERIQGNPLNLDGHRCYFFRRDILPHDVCVPLLPDAPDPPHGFSDVGRYFYALSTYLREQPSALNLDRKIEGIVWHDRGRGGYHFVGKIKAKDFKAAAAPVTA
jgi:hypothetical protein